MKSILQSKVLLEYELFAMPRHSKNNSAGKVFTRDEMNKMKSKDGFGTQRQRVGGDSIRPVTHCSLCLHPLQDPRVCPSGHLFCNECILKSLLKQKKAGSRAVNQLNARLASDAEQAHEAELQARESELAHFEATQSKLTASSSTTSSSSSSLKRKRDESGDSELTKNPTKGRQLHESSVAPEKHVAAYWLPSKETAEEQSLASIEAAASAKSVTKCPEGAHALKLKELVQVNFSLTASGETPQCPICLKAIGNTMKLAVLKKCGHVCCQSCLDNVLLKDDKSSLACYVCTKPFKAKKHIIRVAIAGTGFTGSGVKLEAQTDKPGLIC